MDATTPPRRCHPGTRQVGAVSGIVLLGAAVLAGCGSSTSPAASTTPGASQPAGARGPGSGSTAPGQRGPAAFGLAAAITGHTIEVQDPATGQVSVTYSARTRFTQTKKETIAAIPAGACVTAVGSTPAAGTSPANQPTSFTATSVTVFPATRGSCATGAFAGGGRPSGAARPSDAPSGTPSGTPSGGSGRNRGAGRAGRFGPFATGKVLSTSGSTLLVQATGRNGGGTVTDTITVSSTTTVTTTAATTSAALKVGECVSATGSTNSTGAVAATRITLSAPGRTGCTAGFGRRFGGPNDGAPNPGGPNGGGPNGGGPSTGGTHA